MRHQATSSERCMCSVDIATPSSSPERPPSIPLRPRPDLGAALTPPGNNGSHTREEHLFHLSPREPLTGPACVHAACAGRGGEQPRRAHVQLLRAGRRARHGQDAHRAARAGGATPSVPHPRCPRWAPGGMRHLALPASTVPRKAAAHRLMMLAGTVFTGCCRPCTACRLTPCAHHACRTCRTA